MVELCQKAVEMLNEDVFLVMFLCVVSLFCISKCWNKF